MPKAKKSNNSLVPVILIGTGAYLLLSGDSKADTIIDPKPAPTPSPDVLNLYDKQFIDSAKVYGYNWKELKAICKVESNYGRSTWVKNKIVGSGGKRGIMGMTEGTFYTVRNWLGESGYKLDDLWIPQVAILFAAKLHDWNRNFFGGDVKKAVMAYNIGAGNVKSGNLSSKGEAYYSAWKSEFDRL